MPGFSTDEPEEFMEAAVQSITVWESRLFADGSTYEGLFRNGLNHGPGNVIHPDGEKFEGWFRDGIMHGLGVYSWANGTRYSGAWRHGTMMGCGVKRYPGGDEEVGEWYFDQFIGDYSKCPEEVARKVAAKAEFAAAEARMFTKKPGSKVSLANGKAEELGAQHPLVYREDERYLIPGPMGRTQLPPDDPETGKKLMFEAYMQEKVFNSFNNNRDMKIPLEKLDEHMYQEDKKYKDLIERRKQLKDEIAKKVASQESKARENRRARGIDSEDDRKFEESRKAAASLSGSLDASAGIARAPGGIARALADGARRALARRPHRVARPRSAAV